MFTIKIVTGRDENGTTYDEQTAIEHAGDVSDAICVALQRRSGVTQDVFENGERIARVHVDGGIGWA